METIKANNSYTQTVDKLWILIYIPLDNLFNKYVDNVYKLFYLLFQLAFIIHNQIFEKSAIYPIGHIYFDMPFHFYAAFGRLFLSLVKNERSEKLIWKTSQNYGWQHLKKSKRKSANPASIPG